MLCCLYFFFFKQKTAYEMRISDWSSDVCSSDLYGPRRARRLLVGAGWCRMFDVSTGIHRAERRERTKPACEQWALHCAGPDDSLGWTSIVHGSLGIDAESASAHVHCR